MPNTQRAMSVVSNGMLEISGNFVCIKFQGQVYCFDAVANDYIKWYIQAIRCKPDIVRQAFDYGIYLLNKASHPPDDIKDTNLNLVK